MADIAHDIQRLKHGFFNLWKLSTVYVIISVYSWWDDNSVEFMSYLLPLVIVEVQEIQIR